MNISLSSILILVPIEIRKDKKNYIVEDIYRGEFFEMPPVCIDAIQYINNGLNLEETEINLKKLYPEEKIDILDFTSQLLELELIKEVNGIPIDRHVRKKGIGGFLWIPQKAGRLFFNKYTNAIYIILLILNITLLIIYPHLFPNYKDLFVYRYMSLNIPAWLLIGFIIVLIHEFGHILAMRSYGLPTKLGVGHRLFLVAFETDMTPAWKLSSRDRNVLYLAGISFDMAILFLSLMTQILFPGIGGIVAGLLHIIVFNIFIRTVYQCCIYMKTDLYFVFENLTGCYNLMENAWFMLKKRLSFQKNNVPEPIFEGEKKTVALYSVFLFMGIFITIVLYVVYYLPQLLYAVKSTLPGFRESAGSSYFWDACAFMFQVLLSFGLLFYSWSKKLRARA